MSDNKREEGDATCPIHNANTDRVSNAVQRVPTPSAAEKTAREAAEECCKVTGIPAKQAIILNAITRHSGQAVDAEKGFKAHVAKMDKEHPDWLKGNNHGATSLMAVAREFWNAASRGQAVDRDAVKLSGDCITDRRRQNKRQAVDRRGET